MANNLDYIRNAKVDNVTLINHCSTNSKGTRGTLHLTTTHVIFVNSDGKETWILYGHIAEIEKLPLSARGSSIRFKTTTFLNVTLIITRERDCNDVFDTITQFSNPIKYDDLYAFHYNPIDEDLTQRAGWFSYDVDAEFNRLEVPKDLWELTELNLDYKLCDTYPSMFYLPASVTDEIVRGCARFRSKHRLPALTYYHKASQAAICRCAQPLSGFNMRCYEDEEMIQALIRSTPGSPRIYIVDTRPKINAMANRAAGKGYENVANYENVDFHFIGIENIHVMRESLRKLLGVFDAKELTMSAYLQGLEDSGWLKHIKSVMDTSSFIVNAVKYEKRTVLVHCSDGWDRTAQTCSIASLLLDPYYRTIHGFQVLIEKEWLSFGHKFTDRCGMLSGTGDIKETSPIFTQFLESVWQLMNQYPAAFQFNEQFLIDIHYHLYSHQFGTFIGNSEKERFLLKLSDRTYSLWAYMWQNLHDYINPFYSTMQGVLSPLTSMKHFKVWHGLYNRNNSEIHPREIITNFVSSLTDNNTSLKCHIRYVEERIQQLKAFSVDKDSEITEIVDEIELLDMEQEQKGDTMPQDPVIENCVKNDMNCVEVADGFEHLDSITELTKDIPDFAIQWDSLLATSSSTCSCGKHIDHLKRISHCWNCGRKACSLCLIRSAKIPAHYSEDIFPVCRMCYKEIPKLLST